MRAAVLHEVGTPLAIEDLVLEPPRAGEVQVRIEAAGVCHSDYHYMTGDLRCPLPVVVGHEGAGVVEDVGAGVETVRAGDTVALLWRPRCGQCPYCLIGQPVLCRLGRVQATTGGLPDDGTTRLRLEDRQVHHLMGVSCFAERVVVSEKSVVRVPDGVPPRIAAITGCAVITGVGAVLNVLGNCAGRSLLVLGAGRRRPVRRHGRPPRRRRSRSSSSTSTPRSSRWRSAWEPRTSWTPDARTRSRP